MAQDSKNPTLHVTQDDRGLWTLSVEHGDGTMELLAYYVPSREHVVEDAQELIDRKIYRNATLQVDEPRPASGEPSLTAARAMELLPRTLGKTPEVSRPAAVPSTVGTKSSKWVYWTSDGGGAMDQGQTVETLYDWIRNQGQVDLIVYGGDVYWCGTYQGLTDCGSTQQSDFCEFYRQIGNGDPKKADATLKLMCETAGNHDWANLTMCYADGKIPYPLPNPVGYETFWKDHASMQPIDTKKKAGARYEHSIDLNGWRLVFLDTGAVDSPVYGGNPWPMGDDARSQWLDGILDHVPGETTRANMIFTHYSRLSCGLAGDNCSVENIWQLLFDGKKQPRAIFTLGGHDHNVSVYDPRDRWLNPTSAEEGVQIMVNGAGGYGFFAYQHGTVPEVYPPSPLDPTHNPGYCVTQMELIGEGGDDGTIVPTEANVTIWSFGTNPQVGDTPTQLTPTLTYTL